MNLYFYYLLLLCCWWPSIRHTNGKAEINNCTNSKTSTTTTPKITQKGNTQNENTNGNVNPVEHTHISKYISSTFGSTTSGIDLLIRKRCLGGSDPPLLLPFFPFPWPFPQRLPLSYFFTLSHALRSTSFASFFLFAHFVCCASIPCRFDCDCASFLLTTRNSERREVGYPSARRKKGRNKGS